MFILSLPMRDKIGDTCNCLINGEPRRVTWRDAHTMVIEPNDIRQIYRTSEDGELRIFWCSSAGSRCASITQDNFGAVIITEDDSGSRA
jgi:hypothetical protein